MTKLSPEAKALKKAVRKANKNGWVGPADEASVADILFDHKFARAIWGGDEKSVQWHDKRFHSNFNISGSLPLWQYHTLYLALSEEPLKYLAAFLDE